MKLPKNIIKKYGISKKAWAVFKGKKKTATRRVKTMGKKKGSGKSSGSNKLVNFAIDTLVPLAYGYTRKAIGDGIQKGAQKIGVNSAYTDEGVMLAASAGVGALIKHPAVRRITGKISAIELERIGELSSMKVPLTSGSGSTLSGMTYY